MPPVMSVGKAVEDDDRAWHWQGGVKAEVGGNIWLRLQRLAAVAVVAAGEGRDVSWIGVEILIDCIFLLVAQKKLTREMYVSCVLCSYAICV